MKRALLIIDVQNEYFTGKLPVTYPVGSLDRILQAREAAVRNGIPVILIQHTAPQQEAKTFVKGSREWEIHPEILAGHYDEWVAKSLPGSFTGTKLEEVLKNWEIDTVVICGYMTQMCCDTTSRQAVHMGLYVEFLSDATGTLDISNAAGSVTAEELHRSILVTQAMRFAQVISTEEWIKKVETSK